MAEVKLPLVGGVSKKALLIGGSAAAALVAFLYLRKRKSGPAADTGTGAADQYPPDGTVGDPSDPNSTDPATGMTYGDEGGGSGDYSGLADQLAASGYTDPNTGQFVFGNTGTGQAAATTNAAWAQNAIAYLGSNVSVDTALLAAALGLYLAGSPLTADQASLVDQAIAVEGYPPTAGTGGYPPGIREAGTPGQGGTGGSGGGVTGGGGSSWAFPAPAGLQAYDKSATGYRIKWKAVKGPQGQVPKGYTIATYDSGGHLVDQFNVSGTATAEYGKGGKGLPKGTYHSNVWADGGPKAPPHATVTVTVTK